MADRVPVFHGRVVEGKLTLDPAEAADRQAYLHGLDGKAVEVIVRRPTRQRSLDQQAWLWGVAYPILAQALGYDRHEVPQLHVALVGECFGTTFDQRFGRDLPRVSTSRLTTREYSEMMEWLVRWSAVEHGVVIPLPGESEAA